MSQNLLEEQRENWGSRTGFVLAAIGSAVGLGNLWGFPYKVYSYGGGAFLVPYVLAMAVIGVPVLILEFSLGHMTQRAAPDAFRSVNRRTEPIGWWGILLSFVIITYYAVILAWCLNYLVLCVQNIFTGGELPWAGKGIEGVKKAGNYFTETYLRQWTGAELADGAKPWSVGYLVRDITISLAVVWILMYLCIFRGVKLVSKVVLLTVPLPWIMLLILTLRGLTLPGAEIGLKYYLEPDWSQLARPETWRWAFGQMFFSMSLAFGVMITYASFLHRKSDINNNAAIIGLADMGTSFIAGIAVFATLGAMVAVTRQAGQPVPITEVAAGGPGLAFVAFPYALAQLPYSAWFGTVFFIALITLGIDSAFSITESVLASLVDKTGWGRNRTLIGLSLVGFAIGLVYCTRGGLEWLGAIDDFINSTWGGIALLGLLECAVLGWFYRIGRLREHANERSDWRLGPWWDWLIRYVAPVLLATLFVWSLLDKASSPGGFLHNERGELNVPVAVGLGIAVLVPILAAVLSLIHSPGADLHAQHAGQPRCGRPAGILGLLAVFGALAALVYSFELARAMRLHPEAESKFLELGGAKWPYDLMFPAMAGAAALAALILGAAVVHRAERTRQRPSSFARFSAGLGVLSMGGAAGICLSIFFAANPMGHAAAAPEDSESQLTSMSYVVLAGMLALLVIGLGWCFYRAIKGAAGEAAAPEQVGEGMDE